MSIVRMIRAATLLILGVSTAGCATNTPYVSDGRTSALHPRVRVETTLGDFVVELDADRSPLTVSNFVQYVQDHYYEGTIFHRVLRDGLIQGGVYTPDFRKRTEGLRPGVEDESSNGLQNTRGTLAMNRTFGKPNSARVDFFINVSDNRNLDKPKPDGTAHTVFGRVIEGMNTVDRIGRTAVGTHTRYAAGLRSVVPLEPVVIRRVSMLDRFDPQRAQQLADRKKEEVRQLARAKRRQAEERVHARLAEIEERAQAKLTTTQSGLKYVDLRVGHGAPPTLHETVEVHYRGTLMNGTEFENTYMREQPLIQPVEQFIKGLAECLLTMYEGGKRIVIVPPELGFGDGGIPQKIPYRATLVFELELLAIRDESSR